LMGLREIYELVVVGDAPAVERLVQQAVEQGVGPRQIIADSLVPAMTEVGARFERAEFFVPEMLAASRAMEAGLGVLRPLLVGEDVRSAGRVVIGTVQGDVHDLGKNLVSTMLAGAGFEVEDLGADVAPERFVEAVRRDGTDILAMSALMTTTMPAMARTVEALVAAGVRGGVKVLVGGAPLSDAYGEEIGADGYAADASSAVREARQLLQV
jgi:5-methyltetrahydrofolate--homocysteine methyltransferase